MRSNKCEISNAISTVLLACLLLSVSGISSDALAAQPVTNLAREYPNAQLFMRMCLRGTIDRHVVERSADVIAPDALVAGGWTPYELPSGADFAIRLADTTRVEVISYSQPVWSYGRMSNRRMITRGFPRPGIWHESNSGEAKKSYQFEGADLLEAGMPLDDFRAAQRLLRLHDFLEKSLQEHLFTARSAPASLTALEQFLGVPRNSAAWQDVREVDSPDAVGNTPGNLFAGPLPDGGWAIHLNLGPRVLKADYSAEAIRLAIANPV